MSLLRFAGIFLDLLRGESQLLIRFSVRYFHGEILSFRDSTSHRFFVSKTHQYDILRLLVSCIFVAVVAILQHLRKRSPSSSPSAKCCQRLGFVLCAFISLLPSAGNHFSSFFVTFWRKARLAKLL